MKGNKRNYIICILWPFFVIVLLGITTPLWFPHLGYALIVADPIEKTDAIVSLGGGDPQRFKVAAEYLKENLALRVITTGSIVPDYMQGTDDEKTFAQLGAQLLIANGVPAQKIVVLNEGTSTYEEAMALKEYSEKNGLGSLMIVTSIYHSRRTRAVYRKLFEGSNIKIVVRPAEGGVYKKEKWWTREDDLIFVNNEWVKMILYLLQGKI